MTDDRQPPPAAAPPSSNKKPAIGILLALAAATSATYLTAGSEGLATKPYWDPAHIRTYCYGETEHVVERAYTKAECSVLLQNRLAKDYAPKVAACLPELADEKRIKIFAAFLDASYNTGPAAVCKSRMARSVHAGDLAGACNGFPGWYATARDRRTGQRIALRGLVIRREKEAALCREGLRS